MSTPRVIRYSQSHGVPNTRYVGKPSTFASPFQVGRDGDRAEVVKKFRKSLTGAMRKRIKAELKGLNLSCHFASHPVHADVLLEIANAPTRKAS